MPDVRPTGIYHKLGIYIDTQQAFYSSYLKDYGLKLQVVYLSIRLIRCVCITGEGRDEDKTDAVARHASCGTDVVIRREVWVVIVDHRCFVLTISAMAKKARS